jgi:hypothetical protein
MHRVLLLAPLLIPILVVIHAAGVMCLTTGAAGNHLQWRGRWQARRQTNPAYFVIKHTPEPEARSIALHTARTIEERASPIPERNRSY